MGHVVYATRKFSFESAHFLPNYKGACANVHGHSYKLEVTMSRNIKPVDAKNPTDHMVVDFKCIDEFVTNLVVKKYDHAMLNDFFGMPTAEHMAVCIYNELCKYVLLKFRGVTLDKVVLWETENSFVEYRGEEVKEDTDSE